VWDSRKRKHIFHASAQSDARRTAAAAAATASKQQQQQEQWQQDQQDPAHISHCSLRLSPLVREIATQREKPSNLYIKYVLNGGKKSSSENNPVKCKQEGFRYYYHKQNFEFFKRIPLFSVYISTLL